jgi:hypothetical protein
MKGRMSWLILLWMTLAFNAYPCSLKSKPIVSLSSPISSLLAELGLGHDPHLHGVSIFHDFTGLSKKILKIPGGEFIPEKQAKSFKLKTIFYDKSRELRMKFERLNLNHIIEVNTLGDPKEVTRRSLNLIKPYLENCKQEIEKLSFGLKKYKPIKDKIFFFYLEPLTMKRLPKIIMVNDSIVQYWSESGHLKSYPSELSYVRVSEKMIHQLKKPIFHIGLVHKKGQKTPKLIKVGQKRWNLLFEGILNPGVTQLKLIQKTDFNKLLVEQGES